MTCSGKPSGSAPNVSLVLFASLDYYIRWPMHGGYNFVSGPLADITLITAFVGWTALFWRNHNCHVHNCWRLAWHPHPGSRASGVQEAPPGRAQDHGLALRLVVYVGAVHDVVHARAASRVGISVG